VDNLNNVRRKASSHFNKRKKEYLKAKIDELESNSTIKNTRDFYRDISDFKKGYQHRINTVKDEKGYMTRDSHSILSKWQNHFSPMLNVYGVRPLTC
jgi:chemotaxis regulatin CheY-phosphate phosphatase CheZ